MNTIPLTVLAYEGPQVRSYLSRLKQAGMLPEKIILMVLKKHPVTGKKIGPLLPAGWRIAYAQQAQNMYCNYWPKLLNRQYPDIVTNTISALKKHLNIDSEATVKDIAGTFDYDQHAQAVDRILVDDLKDARIEESLSTPNGSRTVLYTGGGIVRQNLLSLPKVRFIHIHPGYLPHVLGADCLLWSTLTRGKIGLSAFYMEKNIDTGDVIAAEEYPRINIPLNTALRPDTKKLYQFVFSFIDPILRAEFLIRQVLTKGTDLGNLPCERQDMSKGITYHFMHPRLLKTSLTALFTGGHE